MIIEATGKTIEEAIESGLKELGKDISEVETEVLVQPSSGILGFGKKEAKVRLTVIEKQVEEVPVEAIQVEEASVEVKPVELDGEETRNDAEEIAADAKEFLNTILEKMGISAVIEKMIKADRITLHIHGDDLGVLIGKHGQTLDALQYIINLKARIPELKIIEYNDPGIKNHPQVASKTNYLAGVIINNLLLDYKIKDTILDF